MAVSVREKPPQRLYCLITTPSGRTQRWAADEPKADNTPSGIRFSTTIPGGFESFDCTLPRKSYKTYSDLERLSHVEVKGVGGERAWEGRLERSPRDSGRQVAVSPSAVGYQAHLEDDKTAAEVYVDVDLSHWGGPSTQRKIDNVSASLQNGDGPSATPDSTTGQPALELKVTGAWSATGEANCEGWYDAGPYARIGELDYAWKKSSSISSADTQWAWSANLSSDDILTSVDTSTSLRAAGPSTGTLSASDTNKRYAEVGLAYAAAGGTDGVDYSIFWTQLAVFGNHGLTKQGTASATTSQGLLASDVIADAISRFAPDLSFTTGSDGTIKPTSFVVPQLEFRDPTTVSEIIRQATRFELPDWAVWDEKTFWLYPRNSQGRKWRARIGPSELSETGPQVDRVWNGVVVSFQDVSGQVKTVGPTGSLADSTSDDLIDDDPLNPANVAGIHRYSLLDMGIVSTPEAATEVGRRFLEESKTLDTSGQARLVGYVEDDKGVTHPAWKVRAGDQISFVDAADTSYRRIVKTDYDHDSRTNSIDLDSPPEGMDSLLERLSAVILNPEYGQGPMPAIPPSKLQRGH